jgi:nucleoid-associated protein YgaU
MSINRYADTAIANDTTTGKRNYATTMFPTVPESDSDVFIVSRDGDRLDTLANRFYGDSTLWWIIGMCNGITDSLFIVPGTKLRVPTDIQLVLSYVKSINTSR